MTFDKLVQKKMFLLAIFLLMVSTYFGGNEQMGINKTVNWQWDISNWIFFIKGWTYLISVVGYGIIAILKYWTNKFLSILHLVLLSLVFLTEDILCMDLRLIVMLNIISIVVFLLNVIWTIRNRNRNVEKASR
ncbi:hypothetical protein [Zobellia nedashkovskayae]|uniref:hypothetical protein n=1 Tax=Zobellia nedashkovskayae TaxID=2779510 RepID=UPI00188CF968|nr:hypothetical protein [Zobellia nedashkovskayae]